MHCVVTFVGRSADDGTIRLWQTMVKPYGLWQYPQPEVEDKEENAAEKAEEATATTTTNAAQAVGAGADDATVV